MKNSTKYITSVLTALFLVCVFGIIRMVLDANEKNSPVLKVGFIYDGDASTPYTANFIRAQTALEEEFGEKVEVYAFSNVPEGNCEESIRKLVEEGCGIIFTNSFGYGETAKKIAGEFPDVQFCQATCSNAGEDPFYENYHTFMGEIYEGRYISGVIAGMKLKEMVENGEISPDEAKIGYVGAFPFAEVISGYTAFFLGVRSEVPYAVMTVKYTNTWSSYSLEKKCAEELIAEGCVIISQHSDTIGPAVACEDAGGRVYHVGYNQGMVDVAPTSSLISSRINWEPYIVEAVRAVMNKKQIEDYVAGNVHGNDVGAGLELGWVEMVDLNELIAAKGSAERVEELTKDFKKGKIQVFKGDYTGVDPFDENDVYDLRNGYMENENSSAPSFHYVLKDVICVQ